MALSLQLKKGKPSRFSDHVMVLGALAVCIAGILFTLSVILSPEREVSGTVAKMRIAGVKSKTHYVTLATDSGERLEFDVSRRLYRALGVNDRVRVVYRTWDDEATRVEILDGPRRGRAWKQGFLDVVMGPIAILFGAGAAWLLIRSLKGR